MKRHDHFTRSKSAASLLAILLASMLLLAALTPSYAASASDEPGEDTTIGLNVSAFSTTDIYGSAVNGAVLGEKTLNVFHYFAVWSSDCVREMGYMQEAFEGFAPDVGVYGLLYEDSASTPELCAGVMQANGYTYTCLRIDSVLRTLTNQYPMIPQTFFVDSSGVVVEHFPGRFESYEQLEAMIEAQLGHEQVYHTVQFIDGLTGDVIERVPVLHGADAVPPAPPAHQGYLFAGWDGDYHNVTEDRTVTADYIIDPSYFQQGDVDMDGAITVTDSLITMRYAMGLLVSEGVELYGDMDGDGVITISDAMLILRTALL